MTLTKLLSLLLMLTTFAQLQFLLLMKMTLTQLQSEVQRLVQLNASCRRKTTVTRLQADHLMADKAELQSQLTEKENQILHISHLLKDQDTDPSPPPPVSSSTLYTCVYIHLFLFINYCSVLTCSCLFVFSSNLFCRLII